MENIFHSLLRTSLHSGDLDSGTRAIPAAAAPSSSEPRTSRGELGQRWDSRATFQGELREGSSSTNAPDPNPALGPEGQKGPRGSGALPRAVLRADR